MRPVLKGSGPWKRVRRRQEGRKNQTEGKAPEGTLLIRHPEVPNQCYHLRRSCLALLRAGKRDQQFRRSK
ncbi:hypothetical protein V6N13_081119 [Hibiscus sabdariffa]